MIDPIKGILSRLKAKYPITDAWSEEEGEFKVSGIDDTFYITFLSCDHFILSNNYSWHEHFVERAGDIYWLDGPYSLEEFLNGLFMGTIQIIVKYRGNTFIAHAVGILKEGNVEVIRQTYLFRLKSLFARRWSKQLQYKLGDKHLTA